MALAAVLFAGCMYVAAPAAFAATGKEAITVAIRIIKIVATAAGALFTLVGVLKFAIAHANEDGPAQQKAVLMLAAGIVLVLFGSIVIDTLNVETWIEDL